MPSAFDGVPLVMLEAVNYGLPVIASNVDGMAEFLPKEWLFEADDEKGMIDAICRLSSNASDSVMRKVQTRFSACFEAQTSTRNITRAIEDAICRHFEN